MNDKAMQDLHDIADDVEDQLENLKAIQGESHERMVRYLLNVASLQTLLFAAMNEGVSVDEIKEPFKDIMSVLMDAYASALPDKIDAKAVSDDAKRLFAHTQQHSRRVLREV